MNNKEYIKIDPREIRRVDDAEKSRAIKRAIGTTRFKGRTDVGKADIN